MKYLGQCLVGIFRKRYIRFLPLLGSFAAVLLTTAVPSAAAEWKDLFNGRNLDGWEIRGESIWTVLAPDTLIGQRPNARVDLLHTWPLTAEDYRRWFSEQSWLYTNQQFDEFDLRLDYWLPPGANSGVSIRDTSRARYAFGKDKERSPMNPSHIGYEIQLVNPDEGEYGSGSVYLFKAAKRGIQRSDAWNTLEIQSRHKLIRVLLNGVPVAESPGDPKRPLVGPIGLQLHDRFSWIMFRNIRIREIKASSSGGAR
jgi:Domain of Unknown Function (DUF1080)